MKIGSKQSKVRNNSFGLSSPALLILKCEILNTLRKISWERLLGQVVMEQSIKKKLKEFQNGAVKKVKDLKVKLVWFQVLAIIDHNQKGKKDQENQHHLLQLQSDPIWIISSIKPIFLWKFKYYKKENLKTKTLVQAHITLMPPKRENLLIMVLLRTLGMFREFNRLKKMKSFQVQVLTNHFYFKKEVIVIKP